MNKKPFIISLVTVIVVVIGVYFLIQELYADDTPQTFSYNGYNFAKVDNGLWSVGLNVTASDRPLYLKMHRAPYEVEHVDIIGNFSEFFPTNETYVVFDPNEWEDDKTMKKASTDIVVKLSGGFPLFQGEVQPNVRMACSKDTHEICSEIGVYDCNSEENVISFVGGEKDSVVVEESCITVTAKKDFTLPSSRLVYEIYGIM